MFHEMLLKMYLQKCSERKVSPCILAIILHIIMPYKTNDTFSSQLYAIVSIIFVLIYRCLNYTYSFIVRKAIGSSLEKQVTAHRRTCFYKATKCQKNLS